MLQLCKYHNLQLFHNLWYVYTCEHIKTYIFVKLHTMNHGGTVVITHSPPTSEVGGSNPGPYVRKLVVAYRWSEVYSIER